MLQEKYSHHQIHHLWKPHQVHIRQILTKQFVMFCGFFMILKKHQKVDKNAHIFYVLHCMLITFHLRPLNKSICISIVSLVLTYIWTLLQVTNMFVFVKKCGCFVKKQNPLYFKNSFQLISKFWLVMKSYRNYMHLKYLKNNIWNNVGKHIVIKCGLFRNENRTHTKGLWKTLKKMLSVVYKCENSFPSTKLIISLLISHNSSH